jgi:hypothetical protein
MMRAKWLYLTALMICIFWRGGPVKACEKGAPIAPGLVGAWREEGGEGRLLNLEKGRMIEWAAGNLKVRGLIRQRGEELSVRDEGFTQRWTARLSGGLLHLRCLEQDKPWSGTFHRLDRVPTEVRLEPLPLAVGANLSSARIEEIRNEIASRFKAEQALLKNPATPRSTIDETVKNNLRYLRSLLQEVGWVDAPRFGAKTSVYAVILAKHTHDLPLMMTVMPFAEHDLKNAEEGQTYAVLYDALQLDLGGKQLYGTQIAEDAAGPFVLPMQETRDKVNRRLKTMGLPDLDEYLDVVSKVAYNGKTVQVRPDL